MAIVINVTIAVNLNLARIGSVYRNSDVMLQNKAMVVNCGVIIAHEKKPKNKIKINKNAFKRAIL
jgi:hypothetical protein